MTLFSLPSNLLVTSISAIQSYSLNGEEASTTQQREVMINTMFYAVGLACGIGPLYSVDMRLHQNRMDTSLDMRQGDQMQDAEVMRMQAINKMQIFPGTPFIRGLVSEDSIVRIVVSAPCADAEHQRLRTLGAFMGSTNSMPKVI